MRVALISMVERVTGEPVGPLPGSPRAALAFGGRSVALRQLDFALAWGAERIVCLAVGLDPARRRDLIRRSNDALNPAESTRIRAPGGDSCNGCLNCVRPREYTPHSRLDLESRVTVSKPSSSGRDFARNTCIGAGISGWGTGRRMDASHLTGR